MRRLWKFWKSCSTVTKGDLAVHACFRFDRCQALYLLTPSGPRLLPHFLCGDLAALGRVMDVEGSWIDFVQRVRAEEALQTEEDT